MMDVQLGTWTLLRSGLRSHRNTPIVSRMPDGSMHRYTFAEFGARAQQLMHALDGLGISRGARVATFAWNTYRHLEAYFAVPGSARVLHTLNIRLSADELIWIMNDAEDEAVLIDADLLPLFEHVRDQVPSLQHIIVMGAPATPSPWAVDYEELLSTHPTTYDEPDFAETDVIGLCYTSGTTGRPKGVEYTHRSTFLHALAVSSHGGMSLGPSDAVLPQVPMFHANAWGVPFASVGVGAKLCLYAGALEPVSFVELLHREQVTVSAAVPSVWISLTGEFTVQGRPPRLRHLISGGSQPPLSLIERYDREFDIPVVQAWGMTETSPLGSVAWPHHHLLELPKQELAQKVWSRAGLPVPGIEVSIRDDSGEELPADGSAMGALHVRGPWVADSYLHGANAEQFTKDGWFNTGDVAIVDPDGYFVIADRTKDLIKSGGEWISSVDLEAAIMSMPSVVEAAVIAIADPKWMERPMAFVVVEDGSEVTLDEVHAHLESAGFAKWQLPDLLEIVPEVPKTAVGKFDKKALRARMAG